VGCSALPRAGAARYRTFRKGPNPCNPMLFATGVEVVSRSFRCHAGRQPPWQRNAYEAFNALDFASTVAAVVCA
jgi:hypothetical protein